ncbi:MAG TPA: hypothetical protein VM261_13325 [Kofleriaceae bacterium]|nr:hypothetical protein [Kofleriaceae bacterium]
MLDVSDIEVGRSRRQQSPNVIDLALGPARVRPPQLGDDHVLGGGEVNVDTEDLSAKATLELGCRVRKMLAHDEVDLPPGSKVDDVHHRASAKRVACDLPIDVEALVVDGSQKLLERLTARIDDHVDVAGRAHRAVRGARERAHDHVGNRGLIE